MAATDCGWHKETRKEGRPRRQSHARAVSRLRGGAGSLLRGQGQLEGLTSRTPTGSHRGSGIGKLVGRVAHIILRLSVFARVTVGLHPPRRLAFPIDQEGHGPGLLFAQQLRPRRHSSRPWAAEWRMRYRVQYRVEKVGMIPVISSLDRTTTTSTAATARFMSPIFSRSRFG